MCSHSSGARPLKEFGDGIEESAWKVHSPGDGNSRSDFVEFEKYKYYFLHTNYSRVRVVQDVAVAPSFIYSSYNISALQAVPGRSFSWQNETIWEQRSSLETQNEANMVTQC
jgi:hypothetical protein